MSSSPVKITKNLNYPEAAGKYHRIICMTGKNKGLCYYLQDTRVVMGRSKTADIQILDTQSSREHVELVLVGKNYLLTDLKSQNGVTVNDLKVSQHKLKNSDKIIIGSTVYKYGYLEVAPNELALVEEDEDEDEEEEIEEAPKKKSKKKKAPATPEEKRKKLIYIVVGILGVMFLMPSGGDKKKAPAKEQKVAPTVIKEARRSKVKTKLEKEISQKVKAYIHRGRREAREGNYFRAMEEFNLALMLDPTNGDAAFQMNRAKQRLDEKVEVMFLQATKYKDALKYQAALGTYCSIFKLLKDYPEDERFKEAKKSVADAADKLGLEESENHCF